ncbi:MAG: ABC transporter ATP-binding protein [Chromatocurvus sp.]
MTYQLDVNAVSVRFGDFTAVDNASITLDRGQIGCLLGPSGCGKTTLLRAIAGFQAVSQGSIAVGGRVLSTADAQVSPEQRRVGMVFQDFALFPHLDVSDNVGFGLRHLPRTERRSRIARLLQMVSLGDCARAWPHELSGGQQQRVALARALAPGPDILLLDEPFSSLDSELRTQLATEVRELLKTDGVTAVLVTHDQHEAFAMADSVSLLHDGRIDQTDTPYNLYHRPANAFVAEFIGGGSLIEVTVNAEGELNDQLGVLDMAAQSFAPGQQLRLLIRPDDIQYDESSDIQLRVVDRAFRGANFLYELLLPDGQHVPCLAPSHINIERGSLLPVRFNLQHVVIFNDEHQVFT